MPGWERSFWRATTRRREAWRGPRRNMWPVPEFLTRNIPRTFGLTSIGTRVRWTAMPATFPAIKPENWADAIMLRPTGESNPEGGDVPRFAMLETRWPDPWALALSVLFLSTLISLSIIVAQYQKFIRDTRIDTVAELQAPPQPRTPADISTPKNSSDIATTLPQPAEPVTADPPAPELPGIGLPATPVQPLRPEPLRPTPLQAETTTPDPFAGQPIPRELMENPPPIPVQLQPALVKDAPPAIPAAAAAPKPNQTHGSPTSTRVVTQNPKPAQDGAGSLPVSTMA